MVGDVRVRLAHVKNRTPIKPVRSYVLQTALTVTFICSWSVYLQILGC